MKLFVTNTTSGLVPNYDTDFEEKRKLKIGETYEVSIKKARNYEFHKLYFALIHCSWEYLNEKQQAHFKNDIEVYRKSMEVTAGHCDMVFNLKLKSWVDIPKSIAFDKMDEIAFKDLYEKVKDVIFSIILKNVTEEEFINNLQNF